VAAPTVPDCRGVARCSASEAGAPCRETDSYGLDTQSAFSCAPIIRMPRSARGVVRFGSPPVSKVETPPRTRQLEQCEPDRKPRSGLQTRTVDHGDRDEAGEGHTFHPTPVTVGIPAPQFEATEPSREADGGRQHRVARHSPLPQCLPFTYDRANPAGKGSEGSNRYCPIPVTQARPVISGTTAATPATDVSETRRPVNRVPITD
jgi:hypothetical protein